MLARKTYLKQWGNSQGIMIPKTILAELGINDYRDQELELDVVDQKLVIKKVKNTSRLMMKYHSLLDQEPAKKNLEYNFGQPRGKEIY